MESPGDAEIRAALQRVNKLVAQDNMMRYQEYLSKHELNKAYRRVKAAMIQDPDLEEAQTQYQEWNRLLLAGKVVFEFEHLQAKLRLADEMQLQIQLNTPNGKVLTTDISNENGIFFVEDVLYQKSLSTFVRYSVNSIGLKQVSKSSSGLRRTDFKKFINFRGIQPIQVNGQLDFSEESTVLNVLKQRSAIWKKLNHPVNPWLPPRLVQYQLELEGSVIRVLGSENRHEYTPQMLYWNQEKKRGLLDFGVYQITLNPTTGYWSIQRITPNSSQEDYLFELADNYALTPFFFYREGAYPFLR